MKTKNFPKKIIIYWEEPKSGEPYMYFADRLEDIVSVADPKQIGAVYKLEELYDVQFNATVSVRKKGKTP